MHKALLLFLMGGVMLAQTPPEPAKAPEKVDAALRERVSQFYQFQVEGKYREAERLVADDTKDFFVGTSKASYTGFKIQRIEYSDHFTRAVVTLLVGRNVAAEGFIGHPIETRIPSRWKLEKKQWRWYVDQQKDLPASPFAMGGPPGMPMPGGGMGGTRALPPMPNIPASERGLKADKAEVQLRAAGGSSEQVGIINPTPWTMGISVDNPKIPGLTVKLDRPSVRPGEKALLNIQSSGAVPAPAQPVTVMVRVAKTNQTIPIKVSFLK